jgi:hypothetical protein
MSPYPTTKSRSAWVTNLRSVLVGFGFFFVGSISDVWLQQHARSHSIAMITDAALGIATGLLVLLYERRQGQNIIRKLETIRLMNHHVRNSLQVIAFATSAPQQEELTVDVRDAVDRIEWALREVLPGQRKDDETGFSFALMKPERGGSGQHGLSS